MIVFCLTLVRHGETSHNKHNVIQGQLDVPLSNIGLEQAQKLGVHLQHQKYTHIYSSDLIRAKNTAENILKQSQVCNVEIVEDKKLRERTGLVISRRIDKKSLDFLLHPPFKKFGVIEGKSFKFLKEAAKKSNQSVLQMTPHGAETVQEVQARAHSFFNELCQLMRAIAVKENSSDGGNFTYHDNKSVKNVGSMTNGACSSPSTQPPRNKRKRQDSSDEICQNSTQDDADPDPPNLGDSNPNIKVKEQIEVVEPTFTDEDIRSRLMPCKCETEDSDCPNVSLSPLVSHTITSSSSSSNPPSVGENSTGNSIVVNSTPNSADNCGGGGGGVKPTASSMSLLKTRECDRERRISICSSNDETESALDIIGNVLVVSHGGFLKELVLYFVDKLGCSVPGGKKQATRISPNAGLSKFTVSLTENEDEPPKIICHQIHDKHHLNELGENMYETNRLIAENTAL